jgi:polyisoprenoid-binding protein YceI
MGRAASVLLVLALAACSSPSSTTPTASAATTQLPAGTVSANGPWRFTVDSSSKTTVRVREVLAQIRAPGDAVLTATGMKGSFTLNTDGSFTSSSKITADLTTLRSDESRRDGFIKDNTVETRRFPMAEFVPKAVSGVTLPLPLSGEFKLTLTGAMTVHGKSKDATFTVTARRDGSRLTATAIAQPSFTFGDFGMTVPRVASVLSIEDEIRVEISLVAVETG